MVLLFGKGSIFKAVKIKDCWPEENTYAWMYKDIFFLHFVKYRPYDFLTSV